ncbi:MAG: PD-(D/E)XK nuclease family protein [Candidatus Margulisbacteria bacterium]|nr:PD-(D/E)XK nuclease family protein [Candidatus Margulisiibacteriota bacterium]
MTAHYLYQTQGSPDKNNSFWITLSLNPPKNTLILVPTETLKQEIPHAITLDKWLMKNLDHPPENNAVIEKIALKKWLNQDGGILDHADRFITESFIHSFDINRYKSHFLGPLDRAFQAEKLREKYTQTPPQKNILWHYRHLSDSLKKSISTQVQNKHIFLVGFWKLHDYQKELLTWTLEHALSTSTLLHTDPKDSLYQATIPFLNWHNSLTGPHRTIPISGEQTTPPILISPDSIDHEIQLTCEQILESTQTSDNIAIIIPNKAYLPHLEKALKSHKIPFTSTHTQTIASHPFAYWLCNLIALAKNTSDLRNLSKFLTDPLNHPQHVSRETERVILSHCQEIQAAPTCEQALQTIIKLMHFFQITGRFNQESLDPQQAQQIKEIYDTILQQLQTLQTHYLTLFGNTYTLQNLETILKLVLSEIQTIPPKEISKTGITIIEKSNSVGIQKNQLFVLGLTQGQWPSLLQENLFCPITLREKLDWPTQKDNDQQDLYCLLTAITSTKNVILSATKMHDDTPVLPSPFLTLLRTYLDWELPISPNPTTTYISTKQTLINLGKNEPLRPNQPTFNALPHIPTGPLSASHLETYQSCPYHYYHKYILKEDAEDPSIEEIPAHIWGILIHSILQKFYESLNENPLAFHPENQPALRNRLVTIATILFRKTAEPNAFWDIKHHLLFGTDTQPGLLDAFLNTELSHPLQLVPNQYEVSFSPHKLTDTLTLSGKIDVLLRDPTGNCIAVLDYKTGKHLPTGSDIKNFRSLQLPIYHLIAQEKYPEASCIAGILYQLKDAQNITKSILFVTEEGKQSLDLGRKRPYILESDFHNRLIQHLCTLQDLLTEGYFSPTLHPKLEHMHTHRNELCKNCNYWSTCYYDNRFNH